MNQMVKRVFFWLFIVALISFGILPVFAQTTTSSDSIAVSTADIQGFGVAVVINQPVYGTDFMPPGWRQPTANC